MNTKNNLSVKKTVVGILCVAMLVNSVSMPIYNDVINNSMVVDAVDTNQDTTTIDISKHIEDGEVANGFSVSISDVSYGDGNETKVGRICRTISIEEDGTYILTGSNLIEYENEVGDTLLDTQIVVKEGVTANLILSDLTISNDDGDEKYKDLDGYELNYGASGQMSTKVRTMSPFLIQGTANVSVEKTSTVKSEYSSLFEVEENGTLNIKEDTENQSLNMGLVTAKLYQSISSGHIETNRHTMFSGSGSLNIESGNFSGSLTEKTVSSNYDVSSSTFDNICFDVKNMNVSGGVYNSSVSFGDANGYRFYQYDYYANKYDYGNYYNNTLNISGGVFKDTVTLNGDNNSISLSGGKYSNLEVYNYSHNLNTDETSTFTLGINTDFTLNSILLEGYSYYNDNDIKDMVIDDDILNYKPTASEFHKDAIEKISISNVDIDNTLKVTPKDSVTEYMSTVPVELTTTIDSGFIDKYKEYGSITYQWYIQTESGDVITMQKIDGATEPTYTVPNDKCGDFQYVCSITYHETTDDTKTVYSNSANVTVNKLENTIDVSSSSEKGYKTEYPCNETIKNPTNEQFELDDDTAKVSYIWKDSDGNILDGTPNTAGEYTLIIVAEETETHKETTKELKVTRKPHSVTKVEAKDSTCIKEGNLEYYYCEDCKGYYLDIDCTKPTTLEEVTLPKLAHTYKVPTWTWAKDNSSATATFECEVCKDVQILDATVTHSDTEHIATVTFNGKTYTDTIPIKVETTTSVSESVTTPQTTTSVSESVTTPQTTTSVSESVTTPQTTTSVSESVTTPQTTTSVSESVTTPQTTTSVSESVTTSQTTTSVSESVTTSQTTDILRFGDIDLNEKITTKDLLLLKRYLLGMLSFEEGSQSFINADINKNGKVTTSDLLALKKYLLTGSHPNITWEG